jgi:hypothetical protein
MSSLDLDEARKLPWNPKLWPKPTSDFRFPADGPQADHCAEELAFAIGPEQAALPSWRRRMAIQNVNNSLALLVQVPLLWLSSGDSRFDVAPEPGRELDAWLASSPLGFDVDVALLLLGSPADPEAEIARRRGIVRRRDEIRSRVQAEKARKAEAEAKAAAAAAEREERFHVSSWERLTDVQKLALALSLRLEQRDPELAADLRELAALSGGLLRVPAVEEWWRPARERGSEPNE